MTRKNKVEDLFSSLSLAGDYSSIRGREVTGISSSPEATTSEIIFVSSEAYLPLFASASPLCFVVAEDLKGKAGQAKAPVLFAKDPMLALAKVSAYFHTEGTPKGGAHPTAIVDPSVKLGKNLTLGPRCVVEEGAELGDGVMLGAGAYVGQRVKIGAGSKIFPGVVIYQDTLIGERVRIHANTVIGSDGFGYAQEYSAAGVKHVKIHHTGRVRIGDDVEIGASTTIDRGTVGDTVIGRGSIIDNQVQIGHNCQLGEGVILCGCVGLAGSARIDSFAVVGGLTAVNNKVHIGKAAKVAGFSAVYDSVPAGATYGGYPARPMKDFLKLQAILGKLPEWYAERKKEKRKDA